MSTPAGPDTVGGYLWHGYVPQLDVPEWMLEVCQHSSDAFDHSVDGAMAHLDELFDRLTTTVSPPYIVPLSGGWDSRLILAALRERTDKVVTVTVGCPGQLDYEIAARVAEAACVEHVGVRLDKLTLEWSALAETTRHAPWTYQPDAFFISAGCQAGMRVAGSGASIWSGFLGEALTGGHYRREWQAETPSQARTGFARSQRRGNPAFLASQAGLPNYPEAPPEWRKCAGHREWLDFCIRQRACIAPIVLGGAWHGWKADQGDAWGMAPMIAPYADRDWAGYWLHAPRCLHDGQQLYQRMAEARFPSLFGLPGKHIWGMARHQRTRKLLLRAQHSIRNRFHRHMPWLPIRSRLTDNYVDFQWAFRKRDDYISVVERAIDVLKQREAVPWLDLDTIWREHYRGKRDHAHALQVLLGLAVNLEVHG